MEQPTSSKMFLQSQQALVQQAHAKALKRMFEERQPFENTVQGALAFRAFAKSKMEESDYEAFMSIMLNLEEQNRPPVSHTLARFYSILKNYPEVKLAFGMFLPSDTNLKFQLGHYLEKEKTEDTEMNQDSTSSKRTYNENALIFLRKIRDRFGITELYQKFYEMIPSFSDCKKLDPEKETKLFVKFCVLFQEHGDLVEDFKKFVPNADYSCQTQIVKDTPLSSLENDSDSEDSDDVSEFNEAKDPSIANVYKYGSYKELKFFDKVKNALVYQEVYDNFLRCINLYNEDLITNCDLVKVCTSFLGRHPELLKELKDMLGFKENGVNYEYFPMKMIKMKSKIDPETASDIDYATNGRNGASYRALPKTYQQPICSGRTPLCKEVLNDTWVSFPAWSEDSTFVTSCKTQYEEIMYRIEDERFELDMAIQANTYVIQLLENVQKKITKMSSEDRSTFVLDDTLGGTSTALYQRPLHRLYGDKLEELLAGLKRNPVVAVPIILKRLRGKEEEWKAKQKEFNVIWQQQTDNYYLKSLDHQGIKSKQSDIKTFRPAFLMKEMEMVYAEKKENEEFDSSSPHYLLEFKEMIVITDALSLMTQSLKKFQGLYRNDRSRIEYLITSFIPDFFGIPCTTKKEPIEGSESIEAKCIKKLGMLKPKEIKKEEEPNISFSGINIKDDNLSETEADENEIDENVMSDESSSSIDVMDIFDKMERIFPSIENLPYVLFFVNNAWFFFFRQFHILCDRLSRLLFESNRKDLDPKPCGSSSGRNDNNSSVSYRKIVDMLSRLLSGAIDYNEFEEEARNLYGIHAYISFTMDKLVNAIIRNLQHLVGNELAKECTNLFLLHSKKISESSYISSIERSHAEAGYLRKVEAEMNDEYGFQVVWHKEDRTLTIQMIEKETTNEDVLDPRETEKWSNYVENYVKSDSVNKEILAKSSGAPVILPRNLRRQQEYWKRKVAFVENLWIARHSSSFLKTNYLLNLKAFFPKSLWSKLETNPSKLTPNNEMIPEEVKEDKSGSQMAESMESLNSIDINGEKEADPTESQERDNIFLVSINDEQICQQELVLSGEDVVVDNICYEIKTKENTDEFDEKPVAPDVDEDQLNTQIRLESERASSVLETASHVIRSINVEPEDDNEVVSNATDETSFEKDNKINESKESNDNKLIEQEGEETEATTRARKRAANSYVKRKTKIARKTLAMRDRKRKQVQTREFDDILFDYTNFSSLSDEEKYEHLAMRSLEVNDNTEIAFKTGSYKMHFVNYCNSFIYRRNSLPKAKKNHQKISGLKSLNFNEWHRIWMERYITYDMARNCNRWFFKSDVETFRVFRITVSKWNKTPYFPYTKFKLKYFKVKTA